MGLVPLFYLCLFFCQHKLIGQLPHHGKKFCTTKDDRSLWLSSILLLLYVDFSILQRFTSSLVTLSLGNFTYIASVKPCSLFYSTVRSTYRWLFLLAEHCLPPHMGSQFTCSSTKRELTKCTVPHKTLKTECPPLAKPPSPQNVTRRLLSQNVPIKKCPDTKSP